MYKKKHTVKDQLIGFVKPEILSDDYLDVSYGIVPDLD
jgi:hypothetical protein